ncbi:MAG TPA: single-stranded DNA-binding protein [Mycobacteriales bacterium]|nr:single-stranded DNA-binding protein [Mycobacteriales bacterium]
MTTTHAPPITGYRTLVGNLTRDPELRFSAKGTPWASCGLAVNRRTRQDDGTYVDHPPEFFELVCFGDTASHVAESIGKGDRVIACGKVEEDTWTAKDGTERVAVKIVADEVGASLRFASVGVSRAERRTAEGAPEDAPAEPDPWADSPF